MNKIKMQIFDKTPKGFIRVNAMTTPLGYARYTNGKSFLKGERVDILVKEEFLPLRK